MNLAKVSIKIKDAAFPDEATTYLQWLIAERYEASKTVNDQTQRRTSLKVRSKVKTLTSLRTYNFGK
jgi:hypothetical protein